MTFEASFYSYEPGRRYFLAFAGKAVECRGQIDAVHLYLQKPF